MIAEVVVHDGVAGQIARGRELYECACAAEVTSHETCLFTMHGIVTVPDLTQCTGAQGDGVGVVREGGTITLCNKTRNIEIFSYTPSTKQEKL